LVLFAEAKLGELLSKNPPKFHQDNHGRIIGEPSLPVGINKKKLPPNIESSGRGTIEKHKSLPIGINKKESHYAQEIIVGI
jgi:hypothetical protein